MAFSSSLLKSSSLNNNFNQNLAINMILTFESNSSALYNWKFKAKETMTNLINCLAEYNILLNPTLVNKDQPMELAIYSKAKTNCLKEILKLVVEIEQLLDQYGLMVGNIQKLSLQVVSQNQILKDKFTKYQQLEQQGHALPISQKQKDYQLLLMELLELTTLLTSQYKAQHQLISTQTALILKPIFTAHTQTLSLPPDQVKHIQTELSFVLMHIQYETKLSNHKRNHFIDLLSKLNNKKAQLHK